MNVRGSTALRRGAEEEEGGCWQGGDGGRGGVLGKLRLVRCLGWWYCCARVRFRQCEGLDRGRMERTTENIGGRRSGCGPGWRREGCLQTRQIPMSCSSLLSGRSNDAQWGSHSRLGGVWAARSYSKMQTQCAVSGFQSRKSMHLMEERIEGDVPNKFSTSWAEDQPSFCCLWKLFCSILHQLRLS